MVIHGSAFTSINKVDAVYIAHSTKFEKESIVNHMKILNVQITQNTESIISTIESELHKPIEYKNIDCLNRGYDSFGSVDFSRPDKYIMYLRTGLNQNLFEVNLLHELRHLQQIEDNFPTIINKNNQSYTGEDIKFISEIGSRIQSCILDMDVDRWLQSQGYSQSFFINQRCEWAKSNAKQYYKNTADKLNLSNIVCSLLQVFCLIDEAQVNEIAQLYLYNKSEMELVVQIYKQIKAINPNTQLSCALAMCTIVDTLSIWRYFYIQICDTLIRTHHEYENFLHLHNGEIQYVDPS